MNMRRCRQQRQALAAARRVDALQAHGHGRAALVAEAAVNEAVGTELFDQLDGEVGAGAGLLDDLQVLGADAEGARAVARSG